MQVQLLKVSVSENDTVDKALISTHLEMQLHGILRLVWGNLCL